MTNDNILASVHLPSNRSATEVEVSRVGESTILALDDIYSPVASLLETGERNDDARMLEFVQTC